MKKLLIALIVMLLTGSPVYAQAYEGLLKVKKEEQPAIIMVYNYPQSIVETAFKARLTDKRLKGKTSKGFLNYTGSVIPEISSSPLDYSFKFDESGKKGQEKTTVYMLMQSGSTFSGDPVLMARNAKSFLENTAPHVDRANLVAQIKKQEEVLAKEEKKLRELQSDQSDLEKKLEKNRSEQSSQEKIIHSQKSILADLKARQS